MRLAHSLALLVAALPFLACSGEGDAGGDADTGTAEGDDALAASQLWIGMNGGTTNLAQFDYYEAFRGLAPNQAGDRLCHTYVEWDAAMQVPFYGNPSQPGSLAAVGNWLKAADGKCDRVLITFQLMTTDNGGSGVEPTDADDYAAKMKAFVAIPWNDVFHGKIDYTPWNEPNNATSAGSGLSKPMSADQMAEYYLRLRKICDTKCGVAAGDLATFAPNGGSDPSAVTITSYVTEMMSYIEKHAVDHGLPQGFVPEAFAFHGWRDAYAYAYGDHACTDATKCVTLAMTKTLEAWPATEIWDTEVGAIMPGATATKPATASDLGNQTCTARFLTGLAKPGNRLTRMYLTRMRGSNPDGDPSLFDPAVTTTKDGKTTTTYPAHTAARYLAGRVGTPCQ